MPNSIWFFLAVSFVPILFASATTIGLVNVTISNADSSITYMPPTSRVFIPPDQRDKKALNPLSLHSLGCLLEQGTTYHRWSRTPCSYQRGTGSDCKILDPSTQDDPGITEGRPTTLRFQFTGSAVYLFGLVASSPAPSPRLSNTSPWTTTLIPYISFAIDGQQLHCRLIIFSEAQETCSMCSMNEPIFSHSGLSDDREHELSVTFSPNSNSIFLLSHIVYTRPVAISRLDSRAEPRSLLEEKMRPSQSGSKPELSSTSGVTLRPRSEQASLTPTSSPKKIATFAAAVGTVVGILSILSLVIAFSIIRRRRLAHLRDTSQSDPSYNDGPNATTPRIRSRRISSSTSSSLASSPVESLHTVASEDTPDPMFYQMAGPAPFVPRFLPETSVFPRQAQSVPLPHPPQPGAAEVCYGSGTAEEERSQDMDPPPYDVSIASCPHSFHPTSVVMSGVVRQATESLEAAPAPQSSVHRHNRRNILSTMQSASNVHSVGMSVARSATDAGASAFVACASGATSDKTNGSVPFGSEEGYLSHADLPPMPPATTISICSHPFSSSLLLSRPTPHNQSPNPTVSSSPPHPSYPCTMVPNRVSDQPDSRTSQGSRKPSPTPPLPPPHPTLPPLSPPSSCSRTPSPSISILASPSSSDPAVLLPAPMSGDPTNGSVTKLTVEAPIEADHLTSAPGVLKSPPGLC